LIRHQHRTRSDQSPAQDEQLVHDLFDTCEKLKDKLRSIPIDHIDYRQNRQELLDHYQQLILLDLDYVLEKKLEHDLWTVVLKNDMNAKQEQLKDPRSNRIQIQTSLQYLYEYARGYYMKLLQVDNRMIVITIFLSNHCYLGCCTCVSFSNIGM
jgi:hypothetical protein